MLRTLWRWLVGEPEPDRLSVLVETLIESQQRTQQATLTAIAQISEASTRQAEVLGAYLKLFNTPGDPHPWRNPDTDEVDSEANLKDMVAAGFPQNGSDAEQATWVLNNLDKV